MALEFSSRFVSALFSHVPLQQCTIEDRPPQHIRRAIQQMKEAHKVQSANLLMRTANMLASAAAASVPLTQDQMQSVSEDAVSEGERKIPSNWKIEDFKKPVAPIAETQSSLDKQKLSEQNRSPILRMQCYWSWRSQTLHEMEEGFGL